MYIYYYLSILVYRKNVEALEPKFWRHAYVQITNYTIQWSNISTAVNLSRRYKEFGPIPIVKSYRMAKEFEPSDSEETSGVKQWQPKNCAEFVYCPSYGMLIFRSFAFQE